MVSVVCGVRGGAVLSVRGVRVVSVVCGFRGGGVLSVSVVGSHGHPAANTISNKVGSDPITKERIHLF